MPEQHHHLANKYEDIVNLQGRRHIVVATRLQLVVFVLGILLLCLSYSVFCVLCLYCSGLVVITRQMIGQKDCRDDTSSE